MSEWYEHHLVLGIPISKTVNGRLVIWASPLTLTLTQIAKVVWEWDALMTRVMTGDGDAKNARMPISLWQRLSSRLQILKKNPSDKQLKSAYKRRWEGSRNPRAKTMAEVPVNRSVPSGYDEQFVNPPDEDLQCIICYLPSKEPVLTRCGHKFCRQCLDEHIRRYYNLIVIVDFITVC